LRRAGPARDFFEGGRAYGYRAIPGKPGELEIVEEEAAIVRRIFAAYAAGRTPRDIAHDLNRENVRPPRGRRWNASTINGNAQRGAGLIFKELYAGRIVWNKVHMVIDPDTGKRLSRPTPRDEWQSIDAPQLRIVKQSVWEEAHALKTERCHLASHVKRRAPDLLSDLLRCGCCGSGMSVHDRDKTGKTRIRCSAVRESGSCSNRRIIYLRDVERLVLSGMAEELKDPQLIETYVRNYNSERERLAGSAAAMRARLEAKLDRIEGVRRRTIDLVVKYVISEEDAKQRIAELKEERLCVEAELAALDEAPVPIALHLATLDRYIETVNALAEAMAGHAGAEDDRGPLIADFRPLVHSVVVYPRGFGQRFEVEVKGKPAALVGGGAFPVARHTSGSRLVAGEGLEPPTPGL
jgi:site-specific DNA recombinase